MQAKKCHGMTACVLNTHSPRPKPFMPVAFSGTMAEFGGVVLCEAASLHSGCPPFASRPDVRFINAKTRGFGKGSFVQVNIQKSVHVNLLASKLCLRQ